MITALWQWARQWRLDPEWWTLPRTIGVALLVVGSVAAAWQLAGRSSAPAPAALREAVVVSRIVTNTAQPGGSAAIPPTDRRTAESEKRPLTPAALTRAIQGSLRRADCYDGPINGTWTRSSQDAMARFVAVVNATLPVELPDEVLLSLLESNPAARCASARATPYSPPLPLTAAPRVEPGSIATSTQGAPLPVPLPPAAQPGSWVERNETQPSAARREAAASRANAPDQTYGAPTPPRTAAEEELERPAARGRGARVASKPFRRHIHRYHVRRYAVSRNVARNLRSLKRALRIVFN